jgi:hypothetical protein
MPTTTSGDAHLGSTATATATTATTTTATVVNISTTATIGTQRSDLHYGAVLAFGWVDDVVKYRDYESKYKCVVCSLLLPTIYATACGHVLCLVCAEPRTHCPATDCNEPLLPPSPPTLSSSVPLSSANLKVTACTLVSRQVCRDIRLRCAFHRNTNTQNGNTLTSDQKKERSGEGDDENEDEVAVMVEREDGNRDGTSTSVASSSGASSSGASASDNNNEGCPETKLEFRLWKDHCVRLCPYRPIWCADCGDDNVIFRHHVRHLLHDCVARFITCNACGDTKVRFRDMDAHVRLTCVCVPERCVNACGATVLRRDMSVHCATTCPLQIVPCMLAGSGPGVNGGGCDCKVARESMATHIQDNLLQHFAILVARNHCLETNLTDLRRSVLAQLPPNLIP